MSWHSDVNGVLSLLTIKVIYHFTYYLICSGNSNWKCFDYYFENFVWINDEQFAFSCDWIDKTV